MASQPQPRHENRGKGGRLLRYEGKERKEREDDFNVEKGERLFLPWLSFPLSLLLSSRFSQKKRLSFMVKAQPFLDFLCPSFFFSMACLAFAQFFFERVLRYEGITVFASWHRAHLAWFLLPL
jgi:hypothetical protein